MKRTTEDVARNFTVLWSVKRAEADSCAELTRAKDKSLDDLRRAFGSLEAENRACEDHSRALAGKLDRRKRTGPWVGVGLFALGLWLGSR